MATVALWRGIWWHKLPVRPQHVNLTASLTLTHHRVVHFTTCSITTDVGASFDWATTHLGDMALTGLCFVAGPSLCRAILW